MAEENGNGKNGVTRLGAWAPIISAGVPLVVAFIWIGTIAQDVRGNAEKTVAQEERINRLLFQVQTLQLSMAENCRQLSTVEVQFGTVETIINKTQAANERDTALLWQKAYGQQYPTIFYPISIPHEAMPCQH